MAALLVPYENVGSRLTLSPSMEPIMMMRAGSSAEADAGVRDLWQLQAELGVASNCGSCKEHASEILREKRQETRRVEPEMYRPSVA